MFQIDRNITVRLFRTNGQFSIIKGNNKVVGRQLLTIMEEKNNDLVRIEILKGLLGNNVNDPFSMMLMEYRKNEDGEWKS